MDHCACYDTLITFRWDIVYALGHSSRERMSGIGLFQYRSKGTRFGRSARICDRIDRVCFAKSETFQHRRADPASSFQNLVEVRAVEAVTLGESDLRTRACNRGSQELTNLIVVEYARLGP